MRHINPLTLMHAACSLICVCDRSNTFRKPAFIVKAAARRNGSAVTCKRCLPKICQQIVRRPNEGRRHVQCSAGCRHPAGPSAADTAPCGHRAKRHEGRTAVRRTRATVSGSRAVAWRACGGKALALQTARSSYAHRWRQPLAASSLGSSLREARDRCDRRPVC